MTRQISDVLIYEDIEYHLTNSLLDQYFIEFPEKRPATEISCTALWRGFVATYEIAEGKLLIRDVEVLSNMDLELKSVLSEVSPNNIFEWYSGLIRIDDFRGEFDELPEHGIFEFLEIANGNFIQKRIYNYDELQTFMDQQYEFFLISDEAQNVYQRYRQNNPDITEERVNEIIKMYLLRFTKYVYVD